MKQFVLIDKHAWNADKQLHHHGWDEAKKQDWADKQTGLSHNFWGRACGWYMMALVDTLEQLPPDHPGFPVLKDILARTADGIIRWQDESGLWWQILDQGSREGNYLEATCSSMFIGALAKAANHGWLPRDKAMPVARKGYDALVTRLIRQDSDGTISLTRCCEVAGLGFTNAAGIPRDGSYAYYLSEPIIDNDPKGVGPFIPAGLEVAIEGF